MALIQFDQVTLARAGRVVLEAVDATIGAGQFVGVFGPNGAGKTTLLKAVLGLIRPLRGRIRVMGGAPRRGNPMIGYMPQTRNLDAELRISGRAFVAAALDGHRWGLPRRSRSSRHELDWALDLVEASAYADRPLHRLSGGERQRLLLAQALLGRPKLLLLDEPLMSLDIRYQQAVVSLVARVRELLGCTVLFTAHELNPLLGIMDQVLYMGNRRAVLGTEAEVVNSATLSALFDLPVEVIHSRGRTFVVTAHGSLDSDGTHHDV